MEPTTGQQSNLKPALPEAATGEARHCRTCGGALASGKNTSDLCERCARAAFDEAFRHALPVFLSNIAAWTHGTTDQPGDLTRTASANDIAEDMRNALGRH